MSTRVASTTLAPRLGILADAVLVLAGTGLVAGAAQVSFSLPFTPVPITGQTFAVVLVGASLGTVRVLPVSSSTSGSGSQELPSTPITPTGGRS